MDILIFVIWAYLLFWINTRISIYRDLEGKMWDADAENQHLLWNVVGYRALFSSPDTNKLYEDTLWNCFPVTGEMYWWQHIERRRLGI